MAASRRLTLFALLSLSALLAGFTPTARAATIISIADNFTLTGTGGRVAGGQLNGTKTELGNATWNAWSNAVFNTGDYITGGSSATTGSVPFVISPGLGVEEVSISASATTGGAGWIGVGFKNKASASLYNGAVPADGGQFWVQITASGKAQVFQGTTALLGSAATIANFSTAQPVSVSLSYNYGTGVVAVSVNNVSIYNKVSGYVPAINHAAFETNSPDVAGGMHLNSISVLATDSAAIPEPASLVALLGGIALLAAFVRKVRS